MEAEGRIVTRDWDLYDTRHVVYRPARLTPAALKDGLRLGLPRVLSLVVDRCAGRSSHGSIKHQAKHFFYAAGWKKFEPLWDVVIRARQLRAMTPVLEGVLSKVTDRAEAHSSRAEGNNAGSTFMIDPSTPLTEGREPNSSNLTASSPVRISLQSSIDALMMTSTGGSTPR